MAVIDELAIGRVAVEAVPEAFSLSAQAGWNQTREDWAFFAAHGTVLGARDALGKLVATAALLPFAARFAWISLVIVATSHRGGGLGTHMLRQCIAALNKVALVGVLDATPAGSRIYRALGFEPIMGLERWEGVRRGGRGRNPRVQPLKASDLPKIAALDTAAFGADRAVLLAHFCAREGSRGLMHEPHSGYALARSGRLATHVGPLIATNEGDAIALVEATIASITGKIFIDVPDMQTGIAKWLNAYGFRVQRPFLRMGLGRALPYGDPLRVFAIAGPEYG